MNIFIDVPTAVSQHVVTEADPYFFHLHLFAWQYKPVGAQSLPFQFFKLFISNWWGSLDGGSLCRKAFIYTTQINKKLVCTSGMRV
jgi:hypothetical protein